jgi:acyl-coenzyme A thioesterase PaaI-like protein
MTEKTGEVICEGTVVHMGRKLATSQATLKTLDGKLIAHGTETCAILNPKDL